jgi:hypothetical protein
MRHTTDIKMKTVPQQLHLINRLKRETSTTAADEKNKRCFTKKNDTELRLPASTLCTERRKTKSQPTTDTKIKAASQQKIYSKENEWCTTTSIN